MYFGGLYGLEGDGKYYWWKGGIGCLIAHPVPTFYYSLLVGRITNDILRLPYEPTIGGNSKLQKEEMLLFSPLVFLVNRYK